MAIQSGQILTPARLNKRSVRVRRTTSLSLTTGAVTVVSWDVEEFDNSDMFSGPSTVITLPVAGLWGFVASGSFASNATGLRRLLVDVNSTTTFPTIDARTAVSGDNTAITLSGTHLAAAGDQLRVHAHQTSGGTLAFQGGYFSAWLIES
ncbi:hypothetical protein [Micromonospora sp. NBRC 107095]|uniref:hypothetical protein n=1 Tax=Micromonospora sp. NBRC 107095 TaxID=3032209 RepID=UPI0024A17C18|nr:hypothetical protein [Micromonospora sp. NBRC 107095]GLZ62884.1 hypothetical protein Misp05_64600 [Micromonospora sp. NBRC 107095]